MIERNLLGLETFGVMTNDVFINEFATSGCMWIVCLNFDSAK